MATIETITFLTTLLGKDLRQSALTGNDYYRKMQPKYAFYHWSYKGHPHTINNIPNYIHKHPRENDMMYTARIDRMQPVNFSRALTTQTVFAIWSEAVSRTGIEDGSDEDKFKRDTTLTGVDMDTFMQNNATASYVQGFSVILLDALPEDYKPSSIAVDVERMNLPYATFFSPDNVLDWKYDRFGNLLYVILREQSETDMLRTSNPDIVGAPVLLVTNTQIIRIIQTRNPNASVAGQPQYNVSTEVYPHVLSDFGIMPIIPLCYEKTAFPFMASSALSAVAEIDRSIVNLVNLQDDVFYGQAFGQLLIQADSDDDIKEIQTGPMSAIRYPTETNPPQYISPDVGIIAGLNTGISAAISRIEQIADQRFSDSGGEASALSKAWDFHDREFTINGVAATLQVVENLLWKMFQLATKKIKIGETQSVFAKYSDAFDLKGARQFIDDYTTLAVGTELPPRAKKIGTHTAIVKLLKNITPEDMKEIEEQLDDMEETQLLGHTDMMLADGSDPTDPLGMNANMQGRLDNNAPPEKKPVDNRLQSESDSDKQ